MKFTIRLFDARKGEVLETHPRKFSTIETARKGIRRDLDAPGSGLDQNQPHIQAQILDESGTVVRRYVEAEIVHLQQTVLCDRVLGVAATGCEMRWVAIKSDEDAAIMAGWEHQREQADALAGGGR